MTEFDSARPAHSVSVYPAEQLRVVGGANLGDALGFADELLLDDIYRLSPAAAPQRLGLAPSSRLPFTIIPGTGIGTPGADLHLDCCLTFMSGDGRTTEGLVLVETDARGDAARVMFLPLGPLAAGQDLALVGINRAVALQKFARVACVSFTRGTLITMASGAQQPVERLRIGDRVLTRDDGAREVRWIGHHTVRAVGAFAPILIRAGTLNNARDLLVSPDHRLFIYQRRDHLGAGRAELLVRARHLVNGNSVVRVSGGFVDYYQMLLDAHQIIYAEGIAAESLLVDTRTRAALPGEVDSALAHLLPLHRRSDHGALEVQEALLHRPDAAEVLRRSSTS